MKQTKTQSYVIEDEMAEKINQLAAKHGVSKSIIMRNILTRWDGQYIVMPEDDLEAKGTSR